MMTSMTKMVMTAVFGLAMFGASEAQAGGGHGHGERGGKLCERLECSDAQKAQLAQIRDANKPAMKAERAAMHDLKEQLVAEYRKEPFDAARVKALREQLDARKAAMKSQREAMKIKVDAILTPAQRARMAELKAARGERGAKGKGHHRGGHGGPKGAKGPRNHG